MSFAFSRPSDRLAWTHHLFCVLTPANTHSGHGLEQALSKRFKDSHPPPAATATSSSSSRAGSFPDSTGAAPVVAFGRVALNESEADRKKRKLVRGSDVGALTPPPPPPMSTPAPSRGHGALVPHQSDQTPPPRADFPRMQGGPIADVMDLFNIPYTKEALNYPGKLALALLFLFGWARCGCGAAGNVCRCGCAARTHVC